MIKAIFFDVDGTLISHKLGRMSEETAKALERLQELGIKVFVATGRPILELDQLGLTKFPFNGYVLVNGQICMDQNREILCHEAIRKEDADIILKFFEEQKLAIAIEEKERIYMNMVNENVRVAWRAISSPVPPVEKYQGNDIYLATVFADESECEEICRSVKHCAISRANAFGLDFVNENGSKASGIKNVCKLYGFSKEEIMAFGDGENDLEMLEFVGIGIAMGNAEEKVRNCADYITASVDEDGIIKALEHFGIL